jgi:hypothetical protein
MHLNAFFLFSVAATGLAAYGNVFQRVVVQDFAPRLLVLIQSTHIPVAM